MTKQKAKEKIENYLDTVRIKYLMLNETGGIVLLKNANTIYLSCEKENVIGEKVETTIKFFEDFLYCQSYFCKPVVSGEEMIVKSAVMVNWMNHNLNWNCNDLFQHVYVLDEENGDIYNAFPARYDIMEDDNLFDEVMDHILNYSVEQIACVCIPFISCLTGKLSYQGFKDYLKLNIMGKQ